MCKYIQEDTTAETKRLEEMDLRELYDKLWEHKKKAAKRCYEMDSMIPLMLEILSRLMVDSLDKWDKRGDV